MQINKLLYLTALLMLSFVSCQNKKLYYLKYEDLPSEKKKEVNEYLGDVKKMYPKKDNEILLMLGYNCFLNESVLINKNIKKEFPEIKNGNSDGKTTMIIVEKKINKNIELVFSDGKKINIMPKEKYDYISVCYNKKFKEWYIEYYNYPHLNISE
ncbi:hypothetical protein [Chryseobacterium sp.]|uniref:hypothetical protein n=1 Tax=Chryseobacterium sp. TaxID=1871047 RepID=UPI0025C46E37|nr:hypothetical protein [Chryseobacterium sp.]MBV8328514.1 hypothetical protein [Chryseobacterium sp.]